MDRRPFHRLAWLGAALAAFAALVAPATSEAQSCREITAKVVAIDQPYFWNRLGATQPHGQIFALERDVVAISGSQPYEGNAKLREDKRPRPLVLRMNVGDCLLIEFTNWLKPTAKDHQPETRDASIHVVGMQLDHIDSDGSYVGENAPSLAAPGTTRFYRLYAEREGTYLLHSAGALTGGPEGDNGTISTGLFGAVHVEPRNSVWYRSQVTEEELRWATASPNAWPLPSKDIATGAVHGFPIVDYAAVYPTSSPHSGLPILRILDGNKIVHSDLTAIIAGGSYPQIGVYPNRNEPFREFTIIFHDEPGAVQAFPHFYDGDEEIEENRQANGGLAHTLHSVRDAFAINYGTGGIGAEIIANRLGVGPMHDCINCLYEEFFLSAWAIGDPAMVVDVPANAPCTNKDQIKKGIIETEPGYCSPQLGAKATRAFYPDDPSNVYHSYLNDHVKFRNLLAGSDDHHIFHLHAHQWLHTPDGDESTYLDSQAIGQGTGFTYEIAHEGSGNRNKTPGDSIFHCHFYPHFAQGMWAMWRTHDVLEIGTPLTDDGKPLAGERALPDGEIAAGTPIPALVPLPGQPMPLPPSAQVSIVGGQVQIAGAPNGNPGYPFYVPAVAGQRPPTPPMDVFEENGVHHDGGLPRHVVTAGAFNESHTRLDFSKVLYEADAFALAEDGEPWEVAAMDYHADVLDGANDGFMETYLPDGVSTGLFEVNGTAPVKGAPYADPCYRPKETDYPNAKRFLTYKAANIQMDVVFNKKGWHFPQQRFLSLWQDVAAFTSRAKPPEPLFIRANTYDCVQFLHTNLVPKEYELDDFQVRTPTDILGQHIHLVKFDVTSSDGGANGFNYEDGTLSPEEVELMIGAINARGGLRACRGCKAQTPLELEEHPFFHVKGAQTTVQRWYVDDVLNKYNADRTLRTVFTHDHFGPSTHQQVGLYAGLVTEREGSRWYHAEDNTPLGFDLAGNPFREDGGPTSWQAVIEGPETFREFMLEFGDFQLAYTRDNVSFPDPDHAINPPGRHEHWDDLLTTKPWVYEKPALVNHRCPDGAVAPCPEAISAEDPGTMVVNYRNEPIALRVKDRNLNQQAPATQGDLSWAFASIARHDPDLNLAEPNYGDTLSKSEEVKNTDPYTPMLRAYEDDDIRLRILVGAHEEEHNFSLHGTRWLFEPERESSGYKASQMMGISEFYDFVIPPLQPTSPSLAADVQSGARAVDFLYKAGSSVDDLWNGIWGLVRVYRGARGDLRTLSTNTDAKAADVAEKAPSYVGACPTSAPKRPYDVVAVSAADALAGGRLLYNDRPGLPGTPLNDPTAILFVRRGDLQYSAKLAETFGSDECALEVKASAPKEPLILRAAAGECVEVTLTNCVLDVRDARGYSLLPNVVDEFNQNQVAPSGHVGLHAQLLSYDMTHSDGLNVGNNPVQTVAPGASRLYRWYAGITQVAGSTVTSTPVEFGAVPLFSSDPIKHSNKGAVGALVVEPPGSTWTEYPDSRAKAKVRPSSLFGGFPQFREFVLVFQNDVNLQYGDGDPIKPLKVSEDPAETGQSAVNYRTEPVWFREGKPPEELFNIDLANTFSNTQVPWDPEVAFDPKTPVFHAVAGEPVRFRLIHPGGDSQNNTWGLHGHVWEEEPWNADSTRIAANATSEWKGAEYGHGPTNAFNAVPKHGAGGIFGVEGDYMWRDYVSWYLSGGIWGIFRVHGSESELGGDEPGWNVTAEAEPAGTGVGGSP